MLLNDFAQTLLFCHVHLSYYSQQDFYYLIHTHLVPILRHLKVEWHPQKTELAQVVIEGS